VYRKYFAYNKTPKEHEATWSWSCTWLSKISKEDSSLMGIKFFISNSKFHKEKISSRLEIPNRSTMNKIQVSNVF